MRKSRIKNHVSSWFLLRQLLYVAVITISLPAFADEPEAWLAKMHAAVHGLSYTGTYIYINDGQLETMQIFHGIDKDGERERLLSMNGEPREILRDKNEVTCILPADQSVVIGKHKPETGLPALVPNNAEELTKYYQMELIGRDRIAGYPAVILSIHPRDNLRYGYRIWLESETGMVLRSDIIDTSGKIMEQMMFTEISLGQTVSGDMLNATVPHEGFRVIADDGPRQDTEKDARPSGWVFKNMPKGFTIKQQLRKPMPMKRHDVVHFILSDGLATVSVYIEKSDGGEKLEGPSSMGGMNAYGREISDYRITVMGEVPKSTVREIAHSLSYEHQ